MSRKHAELERELIEDLEPRTGRTLAGWMAAIDAAGLTEKNAIIDWLRPQGMTFAHASWLERIHNNGGRPIYLDAAGRLRSLMPEAAAPLPPPVREAASPPVRPAAQRNAPPAANPPAPQAAPPADPPPPVVSADTLPALIARGKGLRPLAEMLLREIGQAVPGATFVPAGDLVSIAAPAELGVLLIGPRELRLGLALGATPFDDLLARARIPGAAPRITHMMVVTDARQIAQPLLDRVRRAAETAGRGG